MKHTLLRFAGAILDRARLFHPLLRAVGSWTICSRSAGPVSIPFVKRRRFRSYAILLYHRVNDRRDAFLGALPVRQFTEQMEILARNFNVLALSELLERASRNDIPPGAVAITFDDGYRDNYEEAFPVLRRFGFPATVFLATGPLDGKGPLWHDRIFHAFRVTEISSVHLAGSPFALSTPEARGRALHAALEQLRGGTPGERDRMIDGLLRELEVDDRLRPEVPMLRWSEVETMAGQGITFGAHTVTHPILSRLPLEEAVEEILASRRSVEARLQRPVTLFAYPNGRQRDFTREIRNALGEHGFTAAVTTVPGVNDALTDAFELRRIILWDPNARASAARLLQSLLRPSTES